MNISKVQTDNYFLQVKVNLRLNHLPRKASFKILDAFHGKGIIWGYIKKKTQKNIQVIGIDRRAFSSEFLLVGDNLKFLSSLNLAEFDVVDLDSYGVPFDQLEYILNYDKENKLHHKIFVTFIQSIFGQLPIEMLEILGYSKKMTEKIPSLFNRNGFDKFLNYLALRGIRKVMVKSDKKKHYLFFET